MANRAKAKPRKGANGTGDSLTVFFDRSDPAERKALEAARLLAAKHGRRKQAIIALLEAVYNHYEATDELLSAGEITARLMGSAIQLPAAGLASASLPTPPPRARQHRGGVEISAAPKASANEIAANFLRSSAAFFD